MKAKRSCYEIFREKIFGMTIILTDILYAIYHYFVADEPWIFKISKFYKFGTPAYILECFDMFECVCDYCHCPICFKSFNCLQKKNKEEQIKEIKEENWKNTAAKISDRLREENEILLKIKNEKKGNKSRPSIMLEIQEAKTENNNLYNEIIQLS